MTAPTTRVAPAADALVGTTLRGTYLVHEALDEGGMGMVFIAEHLRLRRNFAVKVLAKHLAEDAHALARFQREAEIISQLNHPSIVQVVDFDTTESGQPYLVMELLQGESLEAKLERLCQLAPDEAIRITALAASGLTAAHQAHIVHRDLKPANIFLMQVPGEEPFVKLLDFGISKRAGISGGLTGEFDILGTPDYMAPEQASGRTAQVDHRGDQFALAVIAYQMLTGMLPFAGSNVMEILRHVLNDTPCPASEIDETLPKALDAVLAKALSKDPAERFESIGLFAQELATAAGYFPLARTSLVPQVAERRGGTPTPGAALPRSASADQLAQRATTRVTHIPPQVATATPINGTRKKSGGPPRSSLTADAVSDYLDQARQALDEGDAEAAVSHAEQALDLANSGDCAIALKSVGSSETLLARIFERRLGELTRSVKINLSGSGAQLSPQHAFLLSRLEGGVTFEEALDLTPLPRPQALRQLVQLLRAGLIQAS